MTTTTYMSAADTAKLLRAALKKNFPKTKFYVRSDTYSGGASIRVYYDGADHTNRMPHPDGWQNVTVPTPKPGAPAKKDVERVAQAFAGSDFNGMIDLKYPVRHTIDDAGNVTGSLSYGDGISGGWDHSGPGTVVSFGADFVFVENELPYDVRSA